MTTRILPPEEWHRLAATTAEPWTPPDGATVIVVEQDGAIVARHVLFNALHAEGLWVDAAYRKGLVGGRLWRGVQQAAREHYGAAAIATMAIDDEVRALLEHVGARRVPGDAYVIPLEDR